MSALRIDVEIAGTARDTRIPRDPSVVSDRDRRSQRILASRFPTPIGIQAQTKGAIVIG